MQKKAFAVFLAGIAITMVWIVAVAASIHYLEPLLPDAAKRTLAKNVMIWVVAAVVLLAPGLLIGGIALRMPKKVPMRCRHCGWMEVFVLDS